MKLSFNQKKYIPELDSLAIELLLEHPFFPNIMIRISLTEVERLELTRLHLDRSSNIGERVHYVLLAASSESAPNIARLLSRNIITIRLWLNRYVKEGLDGLKTIKTSGRPAKKAAIIEAQLQELLNKSTQEYGYQEAGWLLFFLGLIILIIRLNPLI